MLIGEESSTQKMINKHMAKQPGKLTTINETDEMQVVNEYIHPNDTEWMNELYYSHWPADISKFNCNTKIQWKVA